MARPHKCRCVDFDPEVTYFKPRGIMLSELKEVVLGKDELEAVRLKDLKGLEQTVAAEKMNISQPTFHRLVVSARKKIAEALIKGKALRIDGGNVKISSPQRRGRGRRRRHENRSADK